VDAVVLGWWYWDESLFNSTNGDLRTGADVNTGDVLTGADVVTGAHVVTAESDTGGEPGTVVGAESKHPKVEDCVVCMMRLADHALYPCGHLCLGGDCVEAVNDTCPKCRTEIEGISRFTFEGSI